MHEGGFGLVRTPTGELVFTTPAGEELAAAEIEPVALDVEDVNRRLGVVVISEGAQFVKAAPARRAGSFGC